MDKNIVVNNQFSEIKITDRKKIVLTGVKKLVNFNPEEFLIETTLGILLLKGVDLEVIKLDTNEGILSIKGRINNFNYMDSNKKNEVGLIARLFK